VNKVSFLGGFVSLIAHKTKKLGFFGIRILEDKSLIAFLFLPGHSVRNLPDKEWLL
jgi:hypothetical protein